MASRQTAFDAVLTQDSGMSPPKGVTASGPSIPNYCGSKRGACDRCRGQKLRCLRDDQSRDSSQSTCVRCFKAGATCTFGIPKRAGRPPGSNAASPQERRGNGGWKSKKGEMASRPTVDTSGRTGFLDNNADGGQERRGAGGRGSGRSLGKNTVDQESEGETEDTNPVHTLSPSSLHATSNVLGEFNLDFSVFSESLTATLPWPDETLPPFYNNDAEEILGLEAFDPEYSRAFHHYQAQPMDIQGSTASPTGSHEQSRELGANAYGTPAQTCPTNAQISGASDEAMDLDSSNGSAYTALVNPTKASDAPTRRARDWDRERARGSASFGMSSTAKSALFQDLAEEEAGIRFDEEGLSVKEIQHRRVQELSELATDLYAQLAANDPENRPQHTSGARATAFQDQLVGSVLKSSDAFLTLLTSFSTPATLSSPRSPPPPTPSPTNRDDSTGSLSDGGDASPPAPAPEHEDPAAHEPERHSPTHHKLPADGSDNAQLPPPTDMMTVLQLLTCYTCIVHLHSIVHAHILDYMLAFHPHPTPHVDSVPPVFPGMRVGGVSLDKFGTFQVKLLLQISVHVLGEIEMALGLPEGYRVGKRKTARRGVLEASVSGAFVKCLMREGAWRGKRVKCVREQLESLRRVLKEALDS